MNPSAKTKKDYAVTLWVDSRDRDVTSYPSAADFSVKLATPIKMIKSIKLLQASIPIVAGTHTAVAVVIRGLSMCPSGTIPDLEESGGMPSGVLAIVPLVPIVAGGTTAVYRASDNNDWKINFSDVRLTQLYMIKIQLYVWGGGISPSGWGGPSWPTIIYPLTGEAIGVPPVVGNNINLCLRVKYEH